MEAWSTLLTFKTESLITKRRGKKYAPEAGRFSFVEKKSSLTKGYMMPSTYSSSSSEHAPKPPTLVSMARLMSSPPITASGSSTRRSRDDLSWRTFAAGSWYLHCTPSLTVPLAVNSFLRWTHVIMRIGMKKKLKLRPSVA